MVVDLIGITLTVLGLAFFEAITSLDNAIINAEVLSKMSERARKWFLLWGLVIAVFLVRGALPGLIVFAANPALGPIGAFTATMSSDPAVVETVEASGPILLMGGGVFLVFLFFHWLFMEQKHFGLPGEKFFKSQSVWFFAVVSIFLAVITWYAMNMNPMVAFGGVVGSTAFFIVHGFKQNAEQAEVMLRNEGQDDASAASVAGVAGATGATGPMGASGAGMARVAGAVGAVGVVGTTRAVGVAGTGGMSDMSKLLYLEVIDATFSIDGVVGAFAFTFAVPLILVGNGIGAFLVRELTIRNIENVKKYVFLKNGAMYSILVLGAIMILDSFGYQIPSWLSPISTFMVVGFFYWKSCVHLGKNGGVPKKG